MTKSIGHIAFVDGFEYYERDGQIYKASISNVMDVRTSQRIGRWECSLEHAKIYPSVYPFVK